MSSDSEELVRAPSPSGLANERVSAVDPERLTALMLDLMNELRLRVMDMQAALAPFARYADRISPGLPDNHPIIGGYWGTITKADFMRAAAASRPSARQAPAHETAREPNKPQGTPNDR